ncbi:MAG: hypothetical protein J2P58_00095, partial [Acidimicrobiaceae bacterium]|nr:hypothetical protein [Acidimicrobiaceae bacterium]
MSDGQISGALCDRLRVDQVGSLLRPADLKTLLAREAEGAVDEAGLRAAIGQAVGEVIGEQLARGVLPITDGEFWRRGFQETFPNSVSGYAPPAAEVGGVEGSGGQISEAVYVRRRPVVSRLELARNVLLDEYLADREALLDRGIGDEPLKVTLTGPERLTQRFDLEHSGPVYDGFDAFMADVVRIEREMIHQVIAAGCPYVQIDEPAYTAYVDPTSLEWMAERHWDPARGLERAIAADNALIHGLEGATFGLHICRGNAGSHWHREGAYDAIAEQLFDGLE